jgi:hypothetical protein
MTRRRQGSNPPAEAGVTRFGLIGLSHFLSRAKSRAIPNFPAFRRQGTEIHFAGKCDGTIIFYNGTGS